MAADALDIRIARLEGAYEQVDKRLGAIETRLGDLERKIDVKIDGLRGDIERKIDGLRGDLDRKIDTLGIRLIYFVLGSWVTLMLAVLLHGK
jgi:hypothetical protein